MKARELAYRYWREILLALLVAAPLAILPLLGLLWLWTHGWQLYWLAASAFAAVSLIVVPRYWARRPHGVAAPEGLDNASAVEMRALAVLEQRLRAIDTLELIEPKTVADEAQGMVRAIAAVYHPNDPNAHLRSTLPEVLLMSETISRDLREGIQREFPLLRIASFAWYPQGAQVFDTGTRLWNVARFLRLVNPVGAVLSETRGLILAVAIDRLGAFARRRFAAYVAREIGVVAIQLYSGGFRRRAEEIARTAPDAALAPAASPLRVLLAGQPGAGKSALVNALTGTYVANAGPQAGTPAFREYEIAADDVIMLDGPGLVGPPDRAWRRKAASADLVLWVAKANETARRADITALRTLRAMVADEPFRRKLPVSLVLTHADKLPPAGDWTPPYDLGNPLRPKERAMRAACAAWEQALGLTRSTLVRCDAPQNSWNMDALRAAIVELHPQARARQLERANTPDSLWKTAVDTAQSTPSFLRRLRGVLFRKT